MKTHTKYEDTDETFWEMSAAYGERDKCYVQLGEAELARRGF